MNRQTIKQGSIGIVIGLVIVVTVAYGVQLFMPEPQMLQAAASAVAYDTASSTTPMPSRKPNHCTGPGLSAAPDNCIDLTNGYAATLEVKKEPHHVVKSGGQDCSADVGDTVYGEQNSFLATTTYALVAKKSEAETSRYHLYDAFSDTLGSIFFTSPVPGSDLRPHTGIRTITDYATGKEFIVIYQYATCNIEYAAFFAVDSAGIIHHVSITDKTATGAVISSSIPTDWRGDIIQTSEGLKTCFQENDKTVGACVLYRYDPGHYTLVSESLP